MKEIKAFEEAKASGARLSDTGINHTIFWAYRECEETGNELINFSEVIWDKDVEAIIKTCNENEITEFTISSNFSGLITTLAAFEKLGCRMNGLTEVNARHTDWQTGEKERIPAIRISL